MPCPLGIELSAGMSCTKTNARDFCVMVFHFISSSQVIVKKFESGFVYKRNGEWCLTNVMQEFRECFVQ